MYKKLIPGLLIVILSLVCLIYFRVNSKYISIGSQDDYHQTFKELENTSDLIVRIKPTVLSKVHIDMYNNGTPVYGWTNRTVLVDKTYKAPEGFSEKKIKIREPYWKYFSLVESNVFTCLGGYIPMKPGKTYILFLLKNDDGTYQLNYVDQGKYLITNKLIRADTFEKFKPTDFEISYEVPKYREFYKEVIQKYN